jgi:hypothetical protein
LHQKFLSKNQIYHLAHLIIKAYNAQARKGKHANVTQGGGAPSTSVIAILVLKIIGMILSKLELELLNRQNFHSESTKVENEISPQRHGEHRGI